jgi:trimeric autotransporter adhesin
MKSFVPQGSIKLFIVTALFLAVFCNTAIAQVDECTGATPLTVFTGACGGATAGTTIGATQSLPDCTGAGTADDDVWFSFVQIGGLPTIAVIGGAPAGQLKDPVFEVFSGACGSLTSIYCRNGGTTTTESGTIPNTVTLVNGQTYYVRVYSASNLAANSGSFTICITKPAVANDNASGAISLTPAAISTTAGCPGGAAQSTGNLLSATNSGVAVSCGGVADDDLWYSFVAQGTSQVITLSGIGTNIAVAGAGTGGSVLLEVFSSSNNTSTGIFTSIACGQVFGTGMAATLNSFVAGNTYFVRVYSTNNVVVTTNGGFTICVTNPPVNDECAGAISLTPAATCVSGAGGSRADGTLVNTTNSGIAAGCGGTADDDVWYTFVAQYVSQTITVDNIGTNIAVTGAGAGGSAVVEVFSSSDNTCGGTLTTIACGNVSVNNLVAYANSLTVGNTYYIRVYSTNNVRLPGNANFRVCVTNPFTGAPTLFFGKSFINITKGLGGGTVETGDVLEIRAGITLRPTSILDSCAFFDNVPVGTNYIPGSLAILTNEGKVYKSFTDAAGDDEGSITAGAIRINLGFNQNDNPASVSRRGRLKNGNIPTVSGSHVILVSYRVTVTAALNSIINLGGGTFTYSLITDITNILTQNYNQNNVIVYTNTGLCANATGVNVLDAALAGDFNGTFGSGNTINRVASPNMPPGYTYVTQSGGRPGDFTYTITNNMSNNAAGYSTTDAWPKPEVPNVHRIFGVWDVIGDHTGAADPLAGNPAADTTNGGTGGYMLLVNAAYNLDTVFNYPISGLCPNTYYEISFWVRNVCSRCGVDSLGRGASGLSVPAGYIPTDVGDSSGVYPNLSFSIDGVNHYTTGNITYTGQWVQKGFVFQTGAGQTSIVFAIANNAPGGGGNDWALDDIRLSTCTPDLNLVPVGNSNICLGQQLDVAADVISFFNNYTYYQWQVSHDNGATFTDTLSMGNGTPVLSGGNYTYNAPFPSFLADSSQHLVQYRIRVATDPGNLYGGCSFFNGLNIIVMVNNCSWILNTNLVSFDAVLKNRHGILTWKTTDEQAQTRYEVQRSSDGVHFETIGVVNAFNLPASTYIFNDPGEIYSFAYYRIVIAEGQGRKNSQVRLLSVTDAPYDILSVVNPFNNKLSFDLSMPQNSQATIILSDQHGRSVKVVKKAVIKGMNQVEIDNLGLLPGGTYVLQVITYSGSRAKRVIKVNN